jgi:hypothetical protein
MQNAVGRMQNAETREQNAEGSCEGKSLIIITIMKIRVPLFLFVSTRRITKEQSFYV